VAAASNALRVMDEVIIKVRESGPYLVKGRVTLTDADGNLYSADGENIALCRCGGSENKPFCDGSHKINGFSATQRAGVSAAEAPQ
jgi:CDGSH-type Zn-finger protein